MKKIAIPLIITLIILIGCSKVYYVPEPAVYARFSTSYNYHYSLSIDSYLKIAEKTSKISNDKDCSYILGSIDCLLLGNLNEDTYNIFIDQEPLKQYKVLPEKWKDDFLTLHSNMSQYLEYLKKLIEDNSDLVYSENFKKDNEKLEELLDAINVSNITSLDFQHENKTFIQDVKNVSEQLVEMIKPI